MITANHLERISSELESPEYYSHPELYNWSTIYLKLSDNKEVLESEDSKMLIKRFRYSSLREDTVFFNNLEKIYHLLFKVSSEDEFLVKLDILGISREASDFAICYIWLYPCRWFSGDYRKSQHVPFMNEIESRTLSTICQQIPSNS